MFISYLHLSHSLQTEASVVGFLYRLWHLMLTLLASSVGPFSWCCRMLDTTSENCTRGSTPGSCQPCWSPAETNPCCLDPCWPVGEAPSGNEELGCSAGNAFPNTASGMRCAASASLGRRAAVIRIFPPSRSCSFRPLRGRLAWHPGLPSNRAAAAPALQLWALGPVG